MAQSSISVNESSKGPHVLIIGAGIVGMSTAAALMCSNASIVPNLRITVVASEFSPDTTSGASQTRCFFGVLPSKNLTFLCSVC